MKTYNILSIEEFKTNIGNNSRLLGIDPGNTNIGFAICDENKKVATPYKLIKKGKFGIYMTHNGKNYSLKCIRKRPDTIVLEDVIDILLGTKSTNPKVIKMINEDTSIRKGKYGPYVYYKTKTMKKPMFYGVKQLFGANSGYTADDLTKISETKICTALSKL